MVNQERIYHVISRIQLLLSGLFPAAILAFYNLTPQAFTDPQLVYTVSYLGASGILYYLTLHQIVKNRWLMFSTLTHTMINGAMMLTLIIFTGGLNSPYYFLWLFLIAALAAFGFRYTIVIVGLTTAYYFYDTFTTHFGSHHGDPSYLWGHFVQFAITMTAAVLAQWIFSRIKESSSAANLLSRQLGEEQYKAQTILNSIGEGAMVVDRNLQLKVWNPAAAKMTGWDEATARDLKYTAVLNLKDGKDQDLAQRDDPFLQSWHHKTTITRNDLSIMSRSGRKLALSLTVSPIYDDQQNITGGIGLFRDITQEKEVERQRSEFISTASHEMRTPVAAIEGYLALALNPKVATVDQRAQDYLKKAHSNTQHLGKLFGDLLSVTKLEEGRLQNRPEIIELGQLVREVIEAMQFLARKKGLSVRLGAGEGKSIQPLYYVKADPERLREVLNNLIENAIKFTSEGDVAVSITADRELVTISVSDTGIGIAPEDLPHLFQKFYRVDNSATRTIGGTGLGLYLCRAIIELYQGRIWAESQAGKGTTFKFTLPRVSAPQPVELPAAARPVAAPPAVPIVADVVKPQIAG